MWKCFIGYNLEHSQNETPMECGYKPINVLYSISGSGLEWGNGNSLPVSWSVYIFQFLLSVFRNTILKITFIICYYKVMCFHGRKSEMYRKIQVKIIYNPIDWRELLLIFSYYSRLMHTHGYVYIYDLIIHFCNLLFLLLDNI